MGGYADRRAADYGFIFTMILTVYGRMFSLWMYAAIAPIPLSTFAGEPTSSVGKNFIRSYAGCLFAGRGDCLVLYHFFSAISSSPPAVDTGASVVTAVWTYVGELAFNLLVLVGPLRAVTALSKKLWGCKAKLRTIMVRSKYYA